MAAPHLAISTSPGGEDLVLSPHGEWDLGNAEELRAALLDAVEGPSRTTVDLAGTEFVDSVIIGVLIRAHKRAGVLGSELVVINARGIVERAMNVTGALAFLTARQPSLVLLEGGLAG
jgi:anti-sigma B factor antagonist